MAVGGLEHHDLGPDAIETDCAVHPAAFDRRLALELKPELQEELGDCGKVVHHDPDVFHPLDAHTAGSCHGQGRSKPQRSPSSWSKVLDRIDEKVDTELVEALGSEQLLHFTLDARRVRAPRGR
jgi:hypothetical protein